VKSFNLIVQMGIWSICALFPLLGLAKTIEIIKTDKKAKTSEVSRSGNESDKSHGIFKIEEASKSSDFFEHNIQLQLSDPYGIPVPGTKFRVKLTIKKEGPKVTIQLPQVNFLTGPIANAPFEQPFLPPPLQGGYLYTSGCFLPEDIRPTDIVYRSWLAASNNGLSLPFSFLQDPSTFPTPPVGYIVSITNAGALVVQGPGTFGNIIPPGPQILLPTDISYIIQPKIKLKHNVEISTGATNVTQFTNPLALSTAVRDTHINDAFDGVAAWTWTDNSMVADKTNGILNAMVAIGKVNKNGKLIVKKPIQLTDFPPGVMAFDTAVTINRTNKNNIVVSYGVIIVGMEQLAKIFRAVSFDGGKTWPENGPVNIQPLMGFGDYRGVGSDKFGNIWLVATSFSVAGNINNQPFFAVSSDGGVTYQLVFTLPIPSASLTLFDFPQYCFGGNGEGQYGLIFSVDLFPERTNGSLVVGFIPIFGLGSFGTPATPIFLNQFDNNILTSSITASKDGRIWILGAERNKRAAMPNPGTIISTIRRIFKSPGALDQNYAGPWDYAYLNLLNYNFIVTDELSEPTLGYLYHSPQSNLYDDKRKALYNIISAQNPDFSQNMRFYFSVSRNNGQTFSNPINISNSNMGNRGFQSMALDPVKGDLYFGWYDGRNDPSNQSIEYFGAVIPAKELTQLVKKIPLSNPLYLLPPAGIPLTTILMTGDSSD